MTDGEIDFSNYDQAALEESLVAVDAFRYPKNHAALKSEIEFRKKSGSWSQLDEDYREESSTRPLRLRRSVSSPSAFSRFAGISRAEFVRTAIGKWAWTSLIDRGRLICRFQAAAQIATIGLNPEHQLKCP